MPKNVKYAIPGTAAAFVLATGITTYWCRDPILAIVFVLIMAAVVGLSLGVVITE